MTFLNNKKIPCIPRLLNNDKFIMDFKEKADRSNDFLVKHCSLVNGNTELPSIRTKITWKSLITVEFSKYDILKVIRNANHHHHDMISIPMFNVCV